VPDAVALAAEGVDAAWEDFLRVSQHTNFMNARSKRDAMMYMNTRAPLL
jgi:hypothetical protein